MKIIPFLDPADESNVELFTKALFDAGSKSLAGLKVASKDQCAARRSDKEDYQEFETPAIAWLYAVTETRDFDEDFFMFAKVCGVEDFGAEFVDLAKQYFADAVAVVYHDDKPRYWGMV